MKTRIYMSVLFAALFITSSCSDFVDEPKPTADVSETDVFGSEDGVTAFFVGTYNRFRTFYGGGHDAGAYGSILNTWNVKGNDIVRPQFHWFVFEYRYQDNETATGRKTLVIWEEMYEIINSMNMMIAGVEASSFADNVKTAFIAEARALRGLCYHTLVREYSVAYLVNSSAMGVPIYTEPATGESASIGGPRGTVADVYAQARQDLEFASANLTDARRAKYVVNKNVADGLLARVYLDMGMYAEAAAAANDARTGLALSAGTYNDGFNDINSPEWMWGADFDATSTNYYAGFASFWDGSRYPAFYMNENLVNQFSATDVRNTFTQAIPGYPWYLTSKIRPLDDFSEDMVMMRVGEMYLIEAEGLARAGSGDAAAAALLFELQSNRDAAAVASGNTGAALIAEIMLERRKELYGEMGPDFIDARRLGMTMTRDANHTIPIDLIVGDYRYNYPIPQAEIDLNEMITEDDQNPTSN